MELILASASPRRKELLSSGGYKFEVVTSDFEEKSNQKDPEKVALDFAKGKANSVYNNLKNKTNKVVIGADTVVFFGNKILGKPRDEIQARKMLEELSGKIHVVVTAYCILCNNKEYCGYAKTHVEFNDLSKELIDKYISSGLYKGKAGAYGIQDGFNLVKTFDGSYNNVVGFPTEKIFPILERLLK